MRRIYAFNVNVSGNIYQFKSIGTKGTISKIIKFVELTPNFYNAALTDIQV